jgi:hypothetical protein
VFLLLLVVVVVILLTGAAEHVEPLYAVSAFAFARRLCG